MTLYEIIVVIGAVDFWIIKNISGRYYSKSIRKISWIKMVGRNR